MIMATAPSGRPSPLATARPRPSMLGPLVLCFVAAFAALGGLASAGLALAQGERLDLPALLAAPLFGVVSLVTGVLAAVLLLRRGAA